MKRSKWMFSLLLTSALAIAACSAIPIGLTTLRTGLPSTAPLVQVPAATPAPAVPNNSATVQQNAQISGDVLTTKHPGRNLRESQPIRR
jgi:starvation-inducible outer membrane lipoprotein